MLVLVIAATVLRGADREQPLEFTTMIAHWANYAHKDYLPFVEDARPELVQVGFYGAHYWSLAHTKYGAGYPAHFPKIGLRKNRDWLRQLNKKLHQLDSVVVGHFNIEFLVGDPESDEGPRGFFKWYHKLWDEELLGPKPVNNPMDLLQKNADTSPIRNNSYSIGGMKEYWACLNNPHWRTVLKAWVRHGIGQGLDGFVINYFYRHNCLCDHCQSAFRDYLDDRFDTVKLKNQFGITDLASHKFTEIGSWHDPANSTPFKREQLRFSQIATKDCFDEVFVRYGRSLKPALIVCQWNHLGNFGQINGDERCLLPTRLWAKNEDYLWYSTGGSANYTDLKNNDLGEGTLQARYIRGASGDKPYTLGKYENTRTRVAIAELAANGGVPMGFYTRFTHPGALKVITQYYHFIQRHDAIYRRNKSHAEAVLLFPRKSVHNGEVGPVEAFRQTGRALLDRHVLFDILPDDLATPARLSDYSKVYKAGDDAHEGQTKFFAPHTVRVSASRPATGDALHLHLVNYNRTEPSQAKSPGSGIQDENPISVKEFLCAVPIPAGYRLKDIRLFTPEKKNPVEVPSDVRETGIVYFTIPEFLVYAVVELSLQTASRDAP
ncbi:MAG: beta-galactosidase [Verrucomicrobiota bacterium]|nr:beta-galactosidase [Verrucomicrobiota bacterium]